MKHDEILKRIEKLRNELNELLSFNDYDETQVLQVSKELDELINSYMKHRN